MHFEAGLISLQIIRYGFRDIWNETKGRYPEAEQRPSIERRPDEAVRFERIRYLQVLCEYSHPAFFA